MQIHREDGDNIQTQGVSKWIVISAKDLIISKKTISNHPKE